MVGHQDARMKLAVLAPQGLAQPAKVGVAILVIEDAGPAIVATLHDVQRYTVDVDAQTPGHGSSRAEIEPGPFYPFTLLPRAAAEFEYCLDACGVPASLSSEPAGDGERPVLERLC
jgi:hypothetical protein